MTSEECTRLAVRWEAIDAELAGLELKREELEEAVYENRRDALLGEQDELEFQLGQDWLERRRFGRGS